MDNLVMAAIMSCVVEDTLNFCFGKTVVFAASNLC